MGLNMQVIGHFSFEMIPCVFENIMELMSNRKLKTPFVYLPEVTPCVERIMKVRVDTVVVTCELPVSITDARLTRVQK